MADKNTLLALNATNIPDDNTEEVTPADVREVNEQVIGSNANLDELTTQTFLGPVVFNAGATGLDPYYYSEILRSQSSVTQIGPPLDTKQNIIFDSATKTSPNGEVRINGDGVVDILKSGPYFYKQFAEIGRQSSQGNVEAFFQAEASLDGGNTWIPASATLNRRLQNPNSITVFIDIAPVFFPAGIKLRTSFAQSSAGGDPSDPTVGVADGILQYSEPSAALMADGMNGSSSAVAVVYGLVGYDYG